MKYICIENNTVVSLLDYEPNVPSTVEVVKMSLDNFALIEAKTHYFNPITKTIEKSKDEDLLKLHQESTNRKHLAFLSNSDWKVLRHTREKALGIPTSMTEKEYLSLEQERQIAAKGIV
jgi:hypothetical protein